MRRSSDIILDNRTGSGRRARDRLMDGRAPAIPHAVPVERRAELTNLVLFVADELRESALAVGGIESYLARVQDLLDRKDLTAAELAAAVADDDVESRLQLLDDALAALRRSMSQLGTRLP
jgi:hypothetical protein